MENCHAGRPNGGSWPREETGRARGPFSKLACKPLREIMRLLRERGIYRTPDGKEFVVCAGLLGHYLLYDLSNGTVGFPAYVVDVAGRIVAATQPTRWKSEELSDTGQTLREIFATPRRVDVTEARV